MNPIKSLARAAQILAIAMLSLGFASVASAGAHGAKQKDIVDTAISAGSFTTLVAALQAAELVSALQGEGPFTVFAPTDEAFAALPAGTVENLLKPENKAQLQAVLLYHVVPGKIMSGDLSGTVNAETLQGSKARIVANASGVTIDGAKVVTADVVASNGVIHVIDAVILPPAGT